MYIIHIDEKCDKIIEGVCKHKVTFLNDRKVYTEIMNGNEVWDILKKQKLNTCLCDMFMIQQWFSHFGRYDKLC